MVAKQQLLAVSKAYLRKLTRLIKDRKVRTAIREFLVKYDKQINTNNLVITSTGDVFYEGSIGKFTFYKKWGGYYRRKKSSLTGKRFHKDKAFKGSRESAERFALGNKLASRLYKLVDTEKKEYKLYCLLKKRSIELIKQGRTVEEAKEILIDYLRSVNMLKNELSVRQEKPATSEKQNTGISKKTGSNGFKLHTRSTLCVMDIFLPFTKVRAG